MALFWSCDTLLMAWICEACVMDPRPIPGAQIGQSDVISNDNTKEHTARTRSRLTRQPSGRCLGQVAPNLRVHGECGEHCGTSTEDDAPLRDTRGIRQATSVGDENNSIKHERSAAAGTILQLIRLQSSTDATANTKLSTARDCAGGDARRSEDQESQI